MDRIFTASLGTQLLVIQHLRRHLELPPAREYLLWLPSGNNPEVDSFMRSIIATSDFADTLDMRDFKTIRPRTQGPLEWWFESARRLRKDAATLRMWMKKNLIMEEDVELWLDDPYHFHVAFPKGLLRKARYIKFPHCFNHEDSAVHDYRDRLVAQWRAAPWFKKKLYWPWVRWVSGVDRGERLLAYDLSYTFDYLSPWAEQSVDVSHLISLDAFRDTYQTLPPFVRSTVESILAPIRTGRKPLVLLLLFSLSLDAKLHQAYTQSIARIFKQRRELKGCSLAVKVHPGARGAEEERFFGWLHNNIPAQIFPIRSALNLEFMLPQLQPDYVLAGPCGVLPIVKRLQVGQPIVLSEILDLIGQAFPHERDGFEILVRDIEVW